MYSRKIEQRKIEEPEVIVDGDLIGIWYALGDLDKTFYHIERNMSQRTAPPGIFLEYPIFKELRADPRYRTLDDEARHLIKKTGHALLRGLPFRPTTLCLLLMDNPTDADHASVFGL